MAKPEVVLTLAGDSADLEKAMAASAAAAERLAKQVEQSSKQIDGAQERVQRSSKETAAAFDQVGERFDQVDTRAMGARDGITGVQDSMGSLAAFARGDFQEGLLLAGSGLSDLGSAGYNSVIPMTKDLVARLGVVRLAMFGLVGVAAAGAAGLLLWARSANKFEVDLSHAQEDLERFVRTGSQTQTLREVTQATEAWGKQLQFVDKSWKSVLSETSQFGASGLFSKDTWNVLIGKADGARQHIDAVDDSVAEYIDSTGDLNGALQILASAGLSQTQIEAFKAEGKLDGYSAAVARASERSWDAVDATKAIADALKKFDDQLKAQTDPVFAFTHAQQAAASAQTSYNDAVSEFGKQSPQAEQAALDLAQAQLDVVSATSGLSAVNEQELLPTLAKLRDDGYLTSDAFNALQGQLATTQGKVDALDGSRVNIEISYLVRNSQAAAAAARLAGDYETARELSRQYAVPHMAEGGIVTKPTLALIGEAGPEAVVPLGRLGSGGGAGARTVVINGISGLVLASEVARALNMVGGLQVVVR